MEIVSTIHRVISDSTELDVCSVAPLFACVFVFFYLLLEVFAEVFLLPVLLFLAAAIIMFSPYL